MVQKDYKLPEQVEDFVKDVNSAQKITNCSIVYDNPKKNRNLKEFSKEKLLNVIKETMINSNANSYEFSVTLSRKIDNKVCNLAVKAKLNKNKDFSYKIHNILGYAEFLRTSTNPPLMNFFKFYYYTLFDKECRQLVLNLCLEEIWEYMPLEN